MPSSIDHTFIRQATDSFCAVQPSGDTKVTIELEVRELSLIMDALLAIDAGSVMNLEFRDDTFDVALSLAKAFEDVTFNILTWGDE